MLMRSTEFFLEESFDGWYFLELLIFSSCDLSKIHIMVTKYVSIKDRMWV